MNSEIQHFAVNADDTNRARRFYERVFGWQFEAWGPPEFFQIDTGGALRGALQKRREVVAGKPVHGFECTIGVDDVDAVAEAVAKQGGRVVMEKTTIAGVGHLIFFEDTEGNICGAMEYDPGAS